MPNNKSQIEFWAISIFYLSLFDGLRSYLNNISIFLDGKATHLKEDQPLDFKDEDSEAEYTIALEQFEEHFQVLLANSFIIVLVSTLERELSTFCDTTAKVGNLAIKASDFKGSFHDQFKIYISKIVKMKLDFESASWVDIKGLIEVRNSIVHNDGIIEDTSRGRAIRKVNERYPTLNIRGNAIHSTMPFCNQMIQVVHDFMIKLTEQAIEHYK